MQIGGIAFEDVVQLSCFVPQLHDATLLSVSKGTSAAFKDTGDSSETPHHLAYTRQSVQFIFHQLFPLVASELDFSIENTFKRLWLQC